MRAFRSIILLLLFVAFCYGGYRLFFHAHGGGQAGGAMGAPPVSVATTLEKSLYDWREFSGRLEAIDRAEVRPRVSGVITKILFTDGAYVNEGDPLFIIDERPYRAALATAQGNYTSAQANAANASSDFARAQKLWEAKAISKREYDDRSRALRAANGAETAARGALDNAKLNVEYANVRAPIAGRVSRAEVTVGNLVEAGQNAPLLTTIVSQDPLYISFDVDEAMYLQTLRGATPEALAQIPVMMALANETTATHAGVIHSFDNQLNVATGSIRVRAKFPNPDHALLPGLYARARIGSPEQKQVVLVNERAIATDQSKKYVFVIGADNKAEYREITLGASDGDLRVVRTGLKAGENVVVNGHYRVHPGAAITPIMSDMLTLQPLDGQAQPAAPPQ